MEALYAMTGEKKYFDYIKDAMDTFVTDESGAIRDYTLDEFNLDYICNGRQLLYLYKATGDEKYLRAADVLRDQLRKRGYTFKSETDVSRAHPTGDSGTKSVTPTKCGWMGCICPRRSMWNTA
jgi:uncharacterized protein YyaL (SSP411 family)